MTSAFLIHEGEGLAPREIASLPFEPWAVLPAKAAVPTPEFTATPKTQPAFIRAAVMVGTGAMMQPSARVRPSYSTGSNNPGNAQLARIATSSGPRVKTYGAQVSTSLVTMAIGIGSSSMRAA